MTEPVRWRYRNEPDALWAIVWLHLEQARKDPRNAEWLRADAREIEAHLRRTVAA